jgi:hypothetical protein
MQQGEWCAALSRSDISGIRKKCCSGTRPTMRGTEYQPGSTSFRLVLVGTFVRHGSRWSDKRAMPMMQLPEQHPHATHPGRCLVIYAARLPSAPVAGTATNKLAFGRTEDGMAEYLLYDTRQRYSFKVSPSSNTWPATSWAEFAQVTASGP